MTFTNGASLLFTGWAFIGGAFNFPVWTRLLLDRIGDPRRFKPWWRDAYLMTRLGLALLSVSLVGFYTLRLFDLAVTPIITSYTYTAMLRPPFIALQAWAEMMFLWVSTLGGRKRAWHWYWALSVAWALLFGLLLV